MLDQHAEAVLEESEQRFRAVWENASDAMALSTSDGTVIAANPAYYQLYGYTPEEVIGNNFAIIFPADQRKGAQELYEYIFNSPTISPSFETPIIRADGTERIVESRYNFITHNGKRTAMISIVRDITTRKKAEEALQEARVRLHLALKVGHLGTWDWDIVSNNISWSANLEAAFGLSPGAFGATYEGFLELVHPKDRVLVDQEVKRAIEEGTDYKIEFRAVRPDGIVLWTLAHGQVLYDEAGKPLRMVGISKDITERKSIEEASQSSEK